MIDLTIVDRVLAMLSRFLPLAYSFLRLFVWQNSHEQIYLAEVETKDFSTDTKGNDIRLHSLK
jgi:hypothetical protein